MSALHTRPWSWADARADEFVMIYKAFDGVKTYVNSATCTDRRAAADLARSEAFERAQRRQHPTVEPLDADVPDASIWSREPSPAQRHARDRAFVTFLTRLAEFTDSDMPVIAWRWLREDDHPTMRRSWGFCRWVAPGSVEVALRADVSAERTYSTTIHECAHAADHELLRLGAENELLEQRARHVQRVLAE